MISKAWQTRLRALQQKKHRQELGLFFVEGAKNTIELLHSDFEIEVVFATESFYKENEPRLAEQRFRCEEVSSDDLVRAGTFASNNAALAVARTKNELEFSAQPDEWVLVLDDLRDPGNLGTLLRVADWYGLTKVVCSETTADFYNPKVLTASMGSFARMHVWYQSLPNFLSQTDLPIVGTFLGGENLHEFTFPAGGFLIIGNESNGISPEVEAWVTQKITIPRFGSAESLNAGVAAAVVIDNLRRRG
ncbi:MAG: RNA methyltransferase [Sphingobacteriaceae bacterium]|nr:RNA methyltransferase [Cytophagaceae bacterium]